MRGVYYHTSAVKELNKFDKKVREEFVQLFSKVNCPEEIPSRFVKKLTSTNFYEYRITARGNEYRGIAFVALNITMLLFFQKQTNKTPIRYIETAQKRLLSLQNEIKK